MTEPKTTIDIDRTPLTDLVALFMERAGQLQKTGLQEEFDTRYNWLIEEIEELEEAITNGDNIEIDDALADIVWMAIGWLYKRHGKVVGNKIIREVNRANIDKVDPIEEMVFYPGTTKVGKKATWRGPDHETTYREAGLE